ncbi:hypothetical protein H9P43_005472 [Blastocladiella emersonii ATCC 22665]|nr:hypothetical protein H9P43_005469 [Blastocladiella emersonii ATCC 22665]KAI9178810.1 hypothetical protein H9P43_005472 [Blastocladiella emersonii ATCC 22665]
MTVTYNAAAAAAAEPPRKPDSVLDLDAPSSSLEAGNNINDAAALTADRLDGGFAAWCQVAVSFLTYFAVFSNLNSFGLFTAQYKTVDFPSASLSSISLIGAFMPMALAAAGPFTGRLAESWGFRNALALGAVIAGASLVLASFATEVWHLMLTQGLLYGAAGSLGINTGLALIAQWWVERRSTAVGIAVAGSGVGGLIYVNMIQAIMPSIGFAWTLRVLAAINFVLFALGAVLARPRITSSVTTKVTRTPAGAQQPQQQQQQQQQQEHSMPKLNLALFREPRFLLLYFGLAFNTFGFLVPPFLLPTYVAQATPHSAALGSALLTVFNATSIVGRVSMGYLADRLGNVTSLGLSLVGSGVSILTTWLFGGDSQAWLVVFAGLYGFMSGGYLSITPSCVAQLFGVATLASTMGLISTSNILGYALGTPVATALISASKGGALPSAQFAPAIAFAGLTMLVGGILVFILRYAVLDRRVLAKV